MVGVRTHFVVVSPFINTTRGESLASCNCNWFVVCPIVNLDGGRTEYLVSSTGHYWPCLPTHSVLVYLCLGSSCLLLGVICKL